MDVQAVSQPQLPVHTGYEETEAATAFLQQFNGAVEATKAQPMCKTVCKTVSVAPTPRLIDDQETAAAAACLQQLNEEVEKNKTVTLLASQPAAYDDFLQLLPGEPTTSQLIDEAEAMYLQQQDTTPPA